MNRHVPYNKKFELIDKINTAAEWMLYASVLIAVITLVFDVGNFPLNKNVTEFLNGLNCVLAIAYLICDVTANYLFHDAENTRRDDFFDNSLSTTLSTTNSLGYFTNENIAPGIIKMGVNSFENSFFTKSIATAMLPKMVIKSIIVAVFFLSLIVFTERHYVIIFLQVALPLTIFQQTLKLVLFRNRIDSIFQKFQQLFSSTSPNLQTQLIIHNVTSYESTLAWASIKLDSKLFDKKNAGLSTDWQNIKTRLNIQ